MLFRPGDLHFYIFTGFFFWTLFGPLPSGLCRVWLRTTEIVPAPHSEGEMRKELISEKQGLDTRAHKRAARSFIPRRSQLSQNYLTISYDVKKLMKSIKTFNKSNVRFCSGRYDS